MICSGLSLETIAEYLGRALKEVQKLAKETDKRD